MKSISIETISLTPYNIMLIKAILILLTCPTHFNNLFEIFLLLQ